MNTLMRKFDFDDLFVLDMANNHQGSVDHGENIIRECAQVARKHGARAAMKFQFRQLDTFIHPSHVQGSDNKHIPRFLSTRLNPDQYAHLLNVVRDEDLIAECTPFDEESVDLIKHMGFDLLKVASCSAEDWPLLEKIADADMPVVCSTGGLKLHNIDDLVSFFTHRGVDFALMYCVSIYPTPPDDLNLNMIDIMRERYPDLVIGWSTHEDPDDLDPVQIAYAKGARMFERHVGVDTSEIKLNSYSSTPEQVDRWMSSARKAQRMCGASKWRTVPESESAAIGTLRRGVYAARAIKKGTHIKRDQVYFAMPYMDGQVESGAWKDGLVAESDVKQNEPVLNEAVNIPTDPDYMVIKAAVHDVKAVLNEAKIALNSAFEVEYSHHYGIPKFREYGAILINCINREYCKKLIIQLPGQRHPAHFHKRKEETFQVLHGDLNINIDGHVHALQPGETCLIQPGVWHSFWTDTGCIVEELSTTHYNDDSYYADKAINKLDRSERKTIVNHWGRFELLDKTSSAAERVEA